MDAPASDRVQHRRFEFDPDYTPPYRAPSGDAVEWCTRRPPDLIVVWTVFEYCPLSCRFCGYSRQVVRPRHIVDDELVGEWGRVLSEFQQTYGRSVLVSWLGGEPLQWPALPRLSHTLRRDYGLRLGITTNGTRLASRSLRRMLLDDYGQVTISIDGLAEVHNGVREAPGLFQRLRGHVALLRAEDVAGSLLRRVNTVLMRGNVEQFPSFCREMADWGFHELSFNPLGGRDRPEFFPANRLLPEQVAQFQYRLPALRRELAPHGLQIVGSERYLRRMEFSAKGRQLPIDDCRPGSRFLYIDARGRVSPCSFTADDYGIPLEAIRSPHAIHALSERFAEERRRRRPRACDDCHATHVFDKFGQEVPG